MVRFLSLVLAAGWSFSLFGIVPTYGKSTFELRPQFSESPVDGHVYWIKFSEATPRQRPIDRCALQHGYGINSDALRFILAAPLQGRIISASKALQKLASKRELFSYLYFGESFIQELLSTSCREVYVPIQETHNSSILELTERTEKFLKESVCTNGRCALVGHSMGGAVAFNVARRCMQATSLLGQEGCSNLKKIYSATGIIQGAGASALIYGAKILREKQRDDNLIDTLERLLNGERVNALTAGLISGGGIAWDLASDKTPTTNPTWFNLSPLAPMEDDRPLYLINDIALQKKNWLVADFAASATKHQFRGAINEGLGCGQRPAMPYHLLSYFFQTAQNTFCENFGSSLGVIHSQEMKDTFETGARELHAIAMEYNNLKAEGNSSQFLSEALSWEKYQISDGFADYHLAIQSCEKGLTIENPAIKKCTTLRGINHQASAGGALEAARDIINHLK